MSKLIEYEPLISRLYGLLKMHKAGMLMQPIIPGIASVHHRLIKAIAKILTSFLGTITHHNLKILVKWSKD